MYLTPEEERALTGEEGRARQIAMELLCTLGRVFGAKRLIPVTSAQVSGVSYKNMGDAGLEFIEEIARDAKVSVSTTLNPAGMDLERWMEMGIDPEFASAQQRLVAAYARMGIEPTCTCTPYLAGNTPGFGEHVAWSESSAIAYCNSVLGARTNREGGPSALAAAIIGKTPDYGLHRDEHRRATHVVEVNVPMSRLNYALLGLLIGKRLKSGVPYFKTISPSRDDLKTLGAALASAGSVALFHVEDVTPEAPSAGVEDNAEVIHVDAGDLEAVKEQFSSAVQPELVALGCPHCSPDELREIASMLKGRHAREGAVLWVCTSRRAKEEASDAVSTIERFGKVLCDTCMVVSPIEKIFSATATNSGKAALYLSRPDFCSQQVILDPLEELLKRVMT